MHELPFQVGQLAESRSFQVGFRGAWFRCKIHEIGMKGGVVAHKLEYIDYPDQKIGWIKLYQKPKPKDRKRALMLRPAFPTIYLESEMPDICTISEVIVVVNKLWKLGDLVDWKTDDCYWSGKITKILGNGMVEICLLPPPMGEGLCYDAFSKDLRPTLDWCPENGWTVPVPLEGGNSRPCAQVIKPCNLVPGAGCVGNIQGADGVAKAVKPIIRTSPVYNSSISSQSSGGLLNTSERSMTNENQCSTATNGMEFDMTNTSTGRYSCTDSVSDSLVRDASIESVETTDLNDGYDNKYPSKKMRSEKSLFLNSMFSNTLEAAFLDLEELVNRIKWIRDVLDFGMPLSATKRPSWEFLKHHAPCRPK